MNSFDDRTVYWFYKKFFKVSSVSVTAADRNKFFVESIDEWSMRQFVIYRAVRNATEITSLSGLPYRPSSVLRQQLHSPAMRLLSRLEYERSFGASSGSYFLRIP